ncbi:hypothetical protein CDD83_3698 [Cordyceps sp. RAO-2017]|nr:hypothetical protein CDD83_3698 [Cordyceps sp. RAO-2017]
MSLFRQLMANSKTRSSGGCWTCRCRRKKCAENRPVCDTCKALEITCHFEEEKPVWMDGGPRQREMAETIKSEVKRQASQRRDRKYLEMLEAGTAMSLHDDHDVPLAIVTAAGDARPRHEPASGASDTDRSPGSHELASTPTSSNATGSSPPQMPWHSQLFVRREDPDALPDSDLHYLMIYLDYVCPYLFPHYRPGILAGGRGWILDVLQSNKSVYHTTVSLASAFMTVVLNDGDPDHLDCISRTVHKLESQLELGLRELQREMRALNSGPSAFDTKRGLVVMQGIVHLLIFEVATSNKDNWRMHLDAAVALFLRIVPTPEHWVPILDDLYCTSWPPPSMGARRPWSANQASLRFFSAALIYIDVLSSATLGSPPRLCQYQNSVIPGCTPTPREAEPPAAGPLYLEEFFGLPNWIVQVLGDVSALDSWKRLQSQAGTLSVDELVSRGRVLADAINGGLESMERRSRPARGPLEDRFPILVADPTTGSDFEAQPDFQAIWLLATLSYLMVVLWGWQPSRPDIRFPVSQATARLARVPRGSCLRALAWPLCVCGCLSPPEDEETYRAMAHRLGPLHIFGNVKEAMAIMEKVWSCRGVIDKGWSVSRCLNILGYGVLLI